MALSLDVCLRGPAVECNSRRLETADAFRMLSAAGKKCASAATLLRSITKTLLEHGIKSGSFAELHTQPQQFHQAPQSKVSENEDLNITDTMLLLNSCPQVESMPELTVLNSQIVEMADKNPPDGTCIGLQTEDPDLTVFYDRMGQNLMAENHLDDNSWSILLAEIDR